MLLVYCTSTAFVAIKFNHKSSWPEKRLHARLVHQKSTRTEEKAAPTAEHIVLVSFTYFLPHYTLDWSPELIQKILAILSSIRWFYTVGWIKAKAFISKTCSTDVQQPGWLNQNWKVAAVMINNDNTDIASMPVTFLVPTFIYIHEQSTTDTPLMFSQHSGVKWYLVYAKKASRDGVKREVLFENILIDSVHPLLDTSHVVAEIPHIDLVVKLKAILLSLHNNIHHDKAARNCKHHITQSKQKQAFWPFHPINDFSIS